MSCVRTTKALVVSSPNHEQGRSSLAPLSIDAGAGRPVLSEARVEGLRTSGRKIGRHRRGHRSGGGRRDRVRPQVDAARVTRQRHIQPIVDDDAGRRSPGDLDKIGHQVDEPCGFEVAFPDLNEIDGCVHGVASQFAELDACGLERHLAAGQTAAIGHEAEDRALKAHRDVP